MTRLRETVVSRVTFAPSPKNSDKWIVYLDGEYAGVINYLVLSDTYKVSLFPEYSKLMPGIHQTTRRSAERWATKYIEQYLRRVES